MTTMVETASGKTATDENFPVGSFLIAPSLRPHVAAFYDFARAADDIADSPDLEPADKVARLDAFQAALVDGTGDATAFAKPLRLRVSLEKAGVTARHGCDILDAFRQDATKGRYADWADLMDYCARSASPVGRFLLDLHGEDPAHYAASDPLCDALQVLNHLQDCADDHRALDRVYLPEDWLAQNGSAVSDLTRDRATPGLRRVLDLCLDGVDELLDRAGSLPGRLRSRRLAMESSVIVRLARRLAWRLRRGDPLATRVKLTKLDFLRCGTAGALLGWRGR